jgi:hypothetical protein
LRDYQLLRQLFCLPNPKVNNPRPNSDNEAGSGTETFVMTVSAAKSEIGVVPAATGPLKRGQRFCVYSSNDNPFEGSNDFGMSAEKLLPEMEKLPATNDVVVAPAPNVDTRPEPSEFTISSASKNILGNQGRRDS